MATHSFKDLIVWQKAMQAVKATYAVVAQLPKSELFALSDQMRRASISIPSNIAEGQKRLGNAELAHFCGIALGSAAELETQAILCTEIYDIDTSELLALLEEISKMLTKLIASLRNKN